MKKSSGAILGLILGVLCIFGAFIYEGGSVRALILIPPLVIVFGGTLSAILIGFGKEKFLNISTLIKLAYFPRQYDIPKLINSLVDFAICIRKDGLLSIEKRLDELDYPFTRKMLSYLLDGNDHEQLLILAQLEMKAMQDRHNSNIYIFSKAGGYAPTMGIIGTVMGLIMTLANTGGDSTVLIKNIASAFIATLWGVFSANIFWLPIGDRLKLCHLEEKHMMEISLEGVLALQNGEIPSIIKARLISLLPQKEQEKILDY